MEITAAPAQHPAEPSFLPVASDFRQLSEEASEGSISTPSHDEQNPRKRAKQLKRGRSRQRYDRATKQAVLAAAEGGVRAHYLEIAACLGMNPKTADNLVSLHRHGKDLECKSKRQPGATQKITSQDKLNLADPLHYNCLLTLEQLRAQVNKEKLRAVMLQLEEQIEEKDRLQQHERVRFSELDQERCLRIPSVKELYNTAAIRNRNTIARALKDMVYTTKNIAYEKTAMNTPEAMRKRLAFCKWLQPILNDDDHNHVVFVGEMPFYITRSRTRGRAPKELRTMLSRAAPFGSLALKTTVVLAVDERHGLLKGEVFPPQMESRGGRRVLRAHYRHAEFKGFLDQLLALLWKKRFDLQLQVKDSNGAWRRKEIYLLVDGAPEHGQQQELCKQLLTTLQGSGDWDEWLTGSGPTLKLMFFPSNSPVLNLCEFFARTLRATANTKRSEPEFLDKLNDTSTPHGEKQSQRLAVLKDILTTSMADMQRKGPHKHMVNEFRNKIQQAIDKGGFIDMPLPT